MPQKFQLGVPLKFFLTITYHSALLGFGILFFKLLKELKEETAFVFLPSDSFDQH